MDKETLTTILQRGNEQAKILFEDSKNDCHLTCQPVKLLIYYGCEDLNAPQEIFDFAIRLLHKIIEKQCWIGNRFVLAATLIWMSSLSTHSYNPYAKEHITQRDIASVFSITEVSIRNNAQKIMRVLDLKPFKKRSRTIKKNYNKYGISRRDKRNMLRIAEKKNFRRSIQVQPQDTCVFCGKTINLKGAIDHKVKYYKIGVFLCFKCQEKLPENNSQVNTLRKAYLKFKIDKKHFVKELKKIEQ